MARRPGLTPERVLDEAEALLDDGGEGALSLAALAARLGVRPPSLYNHVAGLDGVRRALRLRALHGLADALRRAAAGRAGRDALDAVGGAYRAYALDHRGLYALMQRADAVEGDDAEAAEAGREVVEVVLAVLRGYRLEGDEAVHAARVLRSALHGFVTLEAGGGFGLPLALDASFARLLAVLDAGLRGAAGVEAG